MRQVISILFALFVACGVSQPHAGASAPRSPFDCHDCYVAMAVANDDRYMGAAVRHASDSPRADEDAIDAAIALVPQSVVCDVGVTVYVVYQP